MRTNEIVFEVTESAEGGYAARSLGHSIFTHGKDWNDLKEMARDAVLCHFNLILEDSSVENHEDALSRLLDELGFVKQDLFSRSRAEIIAEAYSGRGQRIAYVEMEQAWEALNSQD